MRFFIYFFMGGAYSRHAHLHYDMWQKVLKVWQSQYSNGVAVVEAVLRVLF